MLHRMLAALLLGLVLGAPCSHAQVFFLHDDHCGEVHTPCCKGKRACTAPGAKCSRDKVCRDCGLKGQRPCQGTTCYETLTVYNGVCQQGNCGRVNTACCKRGRRCGRGLMCDRSRTMQQYSDSGRCLRCGGDRQPSCPKTGCDSGHVKRTSNGLSRCYHAPPAAKVEEAPEDE